MRTEFDLDPLLRDKYPLWIVVHVNSRRPEYPIGADQMKNAFFATLLLSATLCAFPSFGEATPPLFSPEPPEPGAALLVNTYLPFLAAGEFPQALALNDLRGMRQYLLNRRLSDLKSKNPEISDVDIEKMSAQIQLNDLNPARLQEILLQIMKESNFAGMTWNIRGYAPAPDTIGGYLVSISARTSDGKEKPILLGIKKLGEQWLVAPEVLEELMGRKPVIQPAPGVTPPGEVLAVVNSFWKQWQEGKLDDAYAQFGAEYRAKVSPLSFLQQAQSVIAKNGVPTSWAIVQSREIAPEVLGLGVDVQCSTAPMQTIMIFRKMGETWVLLDSQYRMAPSGPVPPAPTSRPLSRPDLQSDLKPVFESTPASTNAP